VECTSRPVVCVGRLQHRRLLQAVEDEVNSETVTKVLYPNDEPEAGKRLRLLRQYFFVSCSLQHVLHIVDDLADLSVKDLPQRFALQLNDTHPSIGVAELMRILVDERQLDWDEAWAITVASFGYTNHTLLPEALETWPLAMFAESLPRHLEIIYEINRRFLDEVRAKFPGDDARLRRMSLIAEDNGKSVRMAHLATVGSHAINGVAALHSELLKDSVLKDFYELWPERFSNKTNGVTPRRFLALANPGLRELLDDTIGDGWLTDLYQLRGLEAYADDTAFHGQWRAVKRANKARLADFVRSTAGVGLNPDWLFDIQVKRIHEYKRQHLNVLNIVTQYRRLKQNSDLQIPPRAFIFGGKAAPGYFMAKRIIKLINAVGETVNADNFFLFGLSVEEVERIKRDGYRPSDYIDGNSELAAVLDLIAGGAFADGDTEVFRPLVDNLRYDDPFLVLADYAAYVSCQ